MRPMRRGCSAKAESQAADQKLRPPGFVSLAGDLCYAAAVGLLHSEEAGRGRSAPSLDDARRGKQSRWRLVGLVAATAIIYASCWPVVAPDLPVYLIPWLDHIRTAGPIGAFAEPFSNYTPPYLYLMAAVSSLPLPAVTAIKLISLAGTAALALAMRSLLRGSDKAGESVVVLLLLPTVVINAPYMGQCDALWAAACLVALACAVRRRFVAMLVWSGVGFAFKAQAIFMAPFILAILFAEKVPIRLWTIPALVYVGAMLPAYLAGWPAWDLATIYVRQVAYFNTIGTAPGIWAFPAVLLPREPLGFFWIGYAASAIAFIAYVGLLARRRLSRLDMVRAALLSSMMLPWLLPKMHERYFFLADVIAFALVALERDRKSFLIFFAVQEASILAILSYGTGTSLFSAGGAVLNALAGAVLVRDLARSGLHPRRFMDEAQPNQRFADPCC